MRGNLFVGLLLAVIMSGCAPKTQDLTQQDIAAIDELRDTLVGAIVAGDAAAYAELCIEDVRLLHEGSPIVTGRSALEAHNAAIFEAISVTSLLLTPVEIYGAGDLAYEVGTQEVTIEPASPQFAGSRKYVHVFRRGSDGEWRFAALMSSNN